MTFISHAQNLEDLILWRALDDVGNGFYLDVGAGDPRRDSVTLAFYERGWSGLNIEPDPQLAARLQAARPRDRTLGVVLSDTAGKPPPDGTAEATTATRHQAAGIAVQVARLGELCDLHAPAEIHFLRVNAQGAEAAVLAGVDFTRHRPWIVVVRTAPGLPRDDQPAWEERLLRAGYRPAAGGGPNRYYVAQEKAAERLPRLAGPADTLGDVISMAVIRRALATPDAGETIPELAEAFARVREAAARSQAEALDLAEARVRQAELAALEARLQARLAEADAALPATLRPAAPPPADRPDGAAPRRVFYDAGLILSFGFNPPVGIVRVERYLAELLARDPSILLRFVIFDQVAVRYRALSPVEERLLRDILFHRYAEREGTETLPEGAVEPPPEEPVRLIAPPPAPAEPALPEPVPEPQTEPPAEAAPEPPPEAPPPRRDLLGRLATSAQTPHGLFGQILDGDLARLLPVQAGHSPVRRLSTRLLRGGLAGSARAAHLALYGAAAPVRAGARLVSHLARTDAASPQPPQSPAGPPTPEAVAERAGEAITDAVTQELARSPAEATQEMVSEAVAQLMPEMVAEARAQLAVEPGAPEPTGQPEPLPPPEAVPEDFLFQPGDALIAISNIWDYIDYGYLTRIVRQGKVRLVSVIYDVIAMEMPYAMPVPVHVYHRHWVELGHLAGHLVAISRHSAERYARFIGAPNDLAPPMSHAYLPNFLHARREEIGETPVAGLLGRRFVVFCSTIETRKNHQLLLQAWDRLREEIDPEQLPVLVFVGSWGWGTETVRLLSERNWRLRDHLRILNAVSDAELIWLYRNARFTAFPALSEGFGLAAAESLSFGTPVVTSDCPALIEASEGLMPAYDPLDLPGWMAELRRLILDDDHLASLRARAAAYRGAGYEDFGNAIRDAVLAGDVAPAAAAEDAAHA